MIRFDCSSIPSHSNVLSASLSLTGTEYGGYGDANVCIYTIDKLWNENEVSWSNATNNSLWQNAGGDYTNIVLKQRENFDGSKTFNFNVTSAVKTFISNPENNHGFMLIPERIADIVYDFKSKENSDNSGRPKLIITYDSQSNNSNVFKIGPNKIVQVNYQNNTLKMMGLKNGKYQISLYSIKGENLYKKDINISNEMFLEKLKFRNGSFVVTIKGNHTNISKLLIAK